MFELDSWFGKVICAFGSGLGVVTGHTHEAINLCMFILTNDL
jgi:hypothetical protein